FELIGDTTLATGWTAGAGWSIAAGTATALATTGIGTLTTTVTAPIGAWCLLQFDMTRSGGSLQPSSGGTNIGGALSTAAHVWGAVFSGGGGSQTLTFTPTTTFSGTVSNPSLKVLTTLNPITNAPTAATCVFTTAERILVACGCADTNGNFDALR